MKRILYVYFSILLLGTCSYLFIVNIENIKVSNSKNIKPVVREFNDFEDFNYYRELYSNDDIIGKIIIKGYIDSLFVQGVDNSFYLTHDLYKNYDMLGSIFLDYRTNILDKKVLIYGHNFKYNKTEFGNLENYLDYNFYKDNSYIEINIDNYKLKYQIFSVYLTNDDYEYFDVDISDYANHYMNLKNNSLYNTEVDIKKEDSILVLQTCSSDYDDYFVIVCAKRIGKRKI